VGLFFVLFASFALLVAATPSAPAAAQTNPRAQQVEPPKAEDVAAYDAAFQESLSNPADPPTLVRFAAAAVKVGDLEGAISALERLLLIDGGNPDVELELGVLYFRLGSLEAAKTYLEAARTSQRSSAETKTRAANYLREASRP